MVCKIKRCRQEAEVYYYGRGVCTKHWEEHSKGELNLKEEFKIKD